MPTDTKDLHINLDELSETNLKYLYLMLKNRFLDYMREDKKIGAAAIKIWSKEIPEEHFEKFKEDVLEEEWWDDNAYASEMNNLPTAYFEDVLWAFSKNKIETADLIKWAPEW